MGPSVRELSVSDVRPGVRRRGGCTDLATLHVDLGTRTGVRAGGPGTHPQECPGTTQVFGASSYMRTSNRTGVGVANTTLFTGQCPEVLTAPGLHLPLSGVDTGHVSVHTH